MSYAKLAIVLTLVSLSASFVLFSIFNYRTAILAGDSTNTTQLSAAASDQIKKLFEYYKNNPDEAATLNQKIMPVGAQSFVQTNFTKLFAKEFANEVIQKNQNGPQIFDGESALQIPNKIDLQNFALQNQDIFDAKSLIPEIKDSEITITNDNSSKAITDYLTAVYVAVYHTFQNLPDTGNNDPDFMTAARIAAGQYRATIPALYKTPVPSILKDFHKKEIALVIAQQSIFQKIADGTNDPLGAMIAFEIAKKIDEQFALLKTDLKNELAAHQ